MNKATVCVIAMAGFCAAFAYDPNGGIVEKKTAIPSKQICVADKQKIISHETVKTITQDARLYSSLPLAVDAPKAPATIELKEVAGEPAMTLYPEEFRAIVNVSALSADKAAQTTVVERVEKELIRAAWYLMGSGYGSSDCITRPVRNLGELDTLFPDRPSPEAFVHCHGGQKIGVKPIQWITYRHACKLGCAPLPSNEVQKVFWEQAKAEANTKPTNPMRITKEKK